MLCLKIFPVLVWQQVETLPIGLGWCAGQPKAYNVAERRCNSTPKAGPDETSSFWNILLLSTFDSQTIQRGGRSDQLEMEQGVVLVTGASGYLGQFVVEEFAKEGWKVRRGAMYMPADSLPPPPSSLLKPRHPFDTKGSSVLQVGCTYRTGDAPQFRKGVLVFRVSQPTGCFGCKTSLHWTLHACMHAAAVHPRLL
jgi:hypothetical protein